MPNIKITVVYSNRSRIDAWNSSNTNDFCKRTRLEDIIKEVEIKIFFSSDTEKHIDESEMIFLLLIQQKKERKRILADLIILINVLNKLQ